MPQMTGEGFTGDGKPTTDRIPIKEIRRLLNHYESHIKAASPNAWQHVELLLERSEQLEKSGGKNDQVEEDNELFDVLREFVNLLIGSMITRGYTIDVKPNGVFVIYKEGPFPTTLGALRFILEKEGILP